MSYDLLNFQPFVIGSGAFDLHQIFVRDNFSGYSEVTCFYMNTFRCGNYSPRKNGLNDARPSKDPAEDHHTPAYDYHCAILIWKSEIEH